MFPTKSVLGNVQCLPICHRKYELFTNIVHNFFKFGKFELKSLCKFKKNYLFNFLDFIKNDTSFDLLHSVYYNCSTINRENFNM